MRAGKSNLCSLFILIYDMKTDNYIFGSDLGSLVESVYLEIPYTVFDEKDTYKKLIDDKITSLKKE